MRLARILATSLAAIALTSSAAQAQTRGGACQQRGTNSSQSFGFQGNAGVQTPFSQNTARFSAGVNGFTNPFGISTNQSTTGTVQNPFRQSSFAGQNPQQAQLLMLQMMYQQMLLQQQLLMQQQQLLQQAIQNQQQINTALALNSGTSTGLPTSMPCQNQTGDSSSVDQQNLTPLTPLVNSAVRSSNQSSSLLQSFRQQMAAQAK